MVFKALLKTYSFDKIIIELLFLYIGIVYFSIAISNILLAICFAVFLFGVFSKKIQLNFKRYNLIVYFFIIIPFILTIYSVVISNNFSIGLKFLWLRFPILIIPLIIIFIEVKDKSVKNGLNLFVFLTILASLKTIYNAIRYVNEDILFVPDFAFFITTIQHPYFGVFVLIALISIIEFNLINNKLLKIFVFILFGLCILLATSRLVYILSFITLCYYLLKKLSKKWAVFSVILLTIFSFAFLNINKNISSKFIRSIQYENSPRLKLWNNSYKVIMSSNSLLFGIGIGDYYYDKKDAYFFSESKEGTFGYNPHNQIIEFFITTGFVGTLILLGTILLGVLNIKKQNNFAIMIFGIIFLFSITESIFNRQYGVQLYSLFMTIIFMDNFKKTNNEIL